MRDSSLIFLEQTGPRCGEKLLTQCSCKEKWPSTLLISRKEKGNPYSKQLSIWEKLYMLSFLLVITPVVLHHIGCLFLFITFALSILKQHPIIRFLINMKILQPMYSLITKLGDLRQYILSLKIHPFIQLNKWASVKGLYPITYIYFFLCNSCHLSLK